MNESESSSSNSETRQTGIGAGISFMLSNKIDALLWLTRVGTIVFTFFAVIPILDTKFYSCYQRALICNAATSALRLHQRLPPVRLTWEFWGLLLLEDSCHYLFFSLLFIYTYPITMALQPIFLFAILHSASYTAVLCEKLGFMSCRNTIILAIQHHQRNVLRFAALSEICLLPLTIFALFSGRGSLVAPFGYYRFLTLRYSSRRNPYTRTVFHELRLILENFANTHGRSPAIRNIILKIISAVSLLAPPLPSQ